MRRTVRSQSGFTLMEVVIAIGVIGFGAMATYTLVSHVIQGNRHVGSQLEAMALIGRLTAEIQDAPFRGSAPVDRDPHLVEGDYRGAGPRDSASRIQTFGYFRSDGTPTTDLTEAALELRYEVRDCAGCGDLGGAEIRIVLDNATPSSTMLLRPIFSLLRREHLRALAQGDEERGW